jgi:hypothetical protein
MTEASCIVQTNYVLVSFEFGDIETSSQFLERRVGRSRLNGYLGNSLFTLIKSSIAQAAQSRRPRFSLASCARVRDLDVVVCSTCSVRTSPAPLQTLRVPETTPATAYQCPISPIRRFSQRTFFSSTSSIESSAPFSSRNVSLLSSRKNPLEQRTANFSGAIRSR